MKKLSYAELGRKLAIILRMKNHTLEELMEITGESSMRIHNSMHKNAYIYSAGKNRNGVPQYTAHHVLPSNGSTKYVPERREMTRKDYDLMAHKRLCESGR